MATSPSAMSQLANILVRVNDVNGPKDAAISTIHDIVRGRDQIGLDIWEVYDAVSRGAGELTPVGVSAKYQALIHRYCTEIGAAVINVYGAYLVIQDVKSMGLSALKEAGSWMLTFLTPGGMAFKAVTSAVGWAAEKLTGKDEYGQASIMRDGEVSLLSMGGPAAGAALENMISTILPFGLFSQVGALRAGLASRSSGPVATASQFQLPPLAMGGAGQQPVMTAQPVQQSAPSTLSQIGTAALSNLANTVISKIGGLFGDMARDEVQDVDRVIYETAVANGVSPELLKQAVNAHLSQLANDDLGYGFSLPDIDQDTR